MESFIWGLLMWIGLWLVELKAAVLSSIKMAAPIQRTNDYITKLPSQPAPAENKMRRCAFWFFHLVQRVWIMAILHCTFLSCRNQIKEWSAAFFFFLTFLFFLTERKCKMFLVMCYFTPSDCEAAKSPWCSNFPPKETSSWGEQGRCISTLRFVSLGKHQHF